MWIRAILLFFLVISTCLHGCSRLAKQFPSFTVREDVVEDQLKAAMEAYTLADAAGTRGEKMGFAKKGVTYAKQCAQLDPKRAACYFYQALNTGLYYQAKIFGYPKAMIRIAKAAHKVNELDPLYEQAGGYRILGKLYLEAPAFNLGSNVVRKDLDKSRAYLEQAVKSAPDYPENHLFLAETLVAQDEWDKARNHLNTAEKQIASSEYTEKELNDWNKIIRKLKKTFKRKRHKLGP